MYIEYKVKSTRQLASAIIQGKVNDVGKIKIETREIDLNADKKRFWITTLKNINDGIKNESFPLNPQMFPRAFEFNDDYEMI